MKFKQIIEQELDTDNIEKIKAELEASKAENEALKSKVQTTRLEKKAVRLKMKAKYIDKTLKDTAKEITAEPELEPVQEPEISTQETPVQPGEGTIESPETQKDKEEIDSAVSSAMATLNQQ